MNTNEGLLADAIEDATHGEYDKAIAILLMNNDVFITEKNNVIGLAVHAGDAFGPGPHCEDLPYSEIKNLWRCFRIDPTWGALAWVVAQVKQRPWRHRPDGLANAGFDVDALVRGELPP